MYYVYELIDPRDGSVFYVGKGKGNRVKAHEREARRGKRSYKCNKIRQILKEHGSIGFNIVKEFKDESKAYAFERKHIAKHDNLTNVLPGGCPEAIAASDESRLAKQTAKSIARMARVLAKHNEVGIWFAGRFHDLARDDAISILSNGIQKLTDILGFSKLNDELLKYNVTIENSV